MSAITLSSKYQLVVPQPVRERLKLEPGMKFEVFSMDGSIQFIPVMDIKKMRGFLKGKLKDSNIVRDQEDRI